MQSRRILLTAVLVVLLFAPGFALAHGSNWMSMLGSMSPNRGAAMPIRGMLQQMDKRLAHMVAQLQTGSMTPEQTQQMHEMVEQMAGMVHKLSGHDGRY